MQNSVDQTEKIININILYKQNEKTNNKKKQ